MEAGTSLSKLRGVQREMVGKTAGVRKHEAETPEEFYERRNRRITQLIASVDSWDLKVHRSCFAWAGHIARMKAYGEHRA